MSVDAETNVNLSISVFADPDFEIIERSSDTHFGLPGRRFADYFASDPAGRQVTVVALSRPFREQAAMVDVA